MAIERLILIVLSFKEQKERCWALIPLSSLYPSCKKQKKKH